MKKHLGKSTNGVGNITLNGPAYIKSGQISIANTDSVEHTVQLLVNGRLTERGVLLVNNGPEIFYNDMEYFIPEGSNMTVQVLEVTQTNQLAVNMFYTDDLS